METTQVDSRATGSAPGSRRHGHHAGVGAALVTTVVVHLLFLTRALGSDEGGFSAIGRLWQLPGSYLYGPLWVDRPPGLIAAFALADQLGPYGVRLAAAATATVLVAAASSAAGALGGSRAARRAAWTAFAFGSTPLFQAQQLNGELIAATLVLTSVGALVWASDRRPGPVLSPCLAVLSGAAAAAAVLTKQNFVDAAVFAVVLLAGLTLVRSRGRARPDAPPPGRLAVSWLAGAAVPSAVAGVWAVTHSGLSALLYAVWGFRADATAVLAAWSWTAPLHRLQHLLLVAALSGLAVLLAVGLARQRRGLLRGEPIAWAIALSTAVEVVGVFGGGNFWPHYLIGLVPMTALAVGLADGAVVEGLLAAAVTLTLVTGVAAAWSGFHARSAAYATGRWVAAAAEPGDSIAVGYSHADVLAASGLRPGYPYAWSLPIRTLDPHLRLLVRRLDASDGPTWFVQWDAPGAWGLDGPAVRTALLEHYREVATVCGHQVWLRQQLWRPIVAPPAPRACGR